MENLKKGDVIILVEDGSKWEFERYGEGYISKADVPGSDWTGSAGVDKATVFVRRLGTNDKYEDRSFDEFEML